MKIDNEIKVIVDTNLWISFLIGRKLSCLLSLLSHPNFELVVSQELLDEIREVSSRPKLMKYFSQEQIALLLDFMSEETLSYQLENITLRCRDPKDDYLLEPRGRLHNRTPKSQRGKSSVDRLYSYSGNSRKPMGENIEVKSGLLSQMLEIQKEEGRVILLSYLH